MLATKQSWNDRINFRKRFQFLFAASHFLSQCHLICKLLDQVPVNMSWQISGKLGGEEGHLPQTLKERSFPLNLWSVTRFRTVELNQNICKIVFPVGYKRFRGRSKIRQIRNVLWLNGNEQKLLLTVCRKSYNYEKSIGTKMNDVDLCLEVVGHVNHCVASPLNISETVEAWFQRTTDRKWPMGYQMVMLSMTSRDPEMSNSWPYTLRTQYLENSWRCSLATIANHCHCDYSCMHIIANF